MILTLFISSNEFQIHYKRSIKSKSTNIYSRITYDILIIIENRSMSRIKNDKSLDIPADPNRTYNRTQFVAVLYINHNFADNFAGTIRPKVVPAGLFPSRCRLIDTRPGRGVPSHLGSRDCPQSGIKKDPGG